MPAQDEYKVRLEVFEGPLDLLLYLIKKEEVDIYNIPIQRITTQYMEYLNLMRMLDLNIAGEFIVMAATLMMIKSRMLLPEDERPALEEEEEDPRWELVRQLVEYKKFKDAAMRLQHLELHQEGVFPLGSDGAILDPQDAGLVLEDVSLFDLITAFNEVLKRVGEEALGEIYGDRFTVADKIDYLLRRVAAEGRVLFSVLFSQMASRHEVVCTFLALLELIRLRHVNVHQKERFAEIVITAAAEEPAPAVKDAPGEAEPATSPAEVAAEADAETAVESPTEH
jgi:segregation and condensation protein A